MRKTLRKIQFKLKNPKTQIEQIIYLNEEYSKIVRQLQTVVDKENKQPLLRRLQTTQDQLDKIKQNLQHEYQLYSQYQNRQFDQFKKIKQIPNTSCLISALEQKQNQINQIENQQKLTRELFKNKLNNQDIDRQIQNIANKILQQKSKRIIHQNKINRIKLQLQGEALNLMKEKTNNLEQEIKLRKLQKQQSQQLIIKN